MSSLYSYLCTSEEMVPVLELTHAPRGTEFVLFSVLDTDLVQSEYCIYKVRRDHDTDTTSRVLDRVDTLESIPNSEE